MIQNQRRHQSSNAIVSTDAAALNKYKKERELHRKVQSLSKEIVEIKATLKRVLDKLEEIS